MNLQNLALELTCLPISSSMLFLRVAFKPLNLFQSLLSLSLGQVGLTELLPWTFLRNHFISLRCLFDCHSIITNKIRPIIISMKLRYQVSGLNLYTPYKKSPIHARDSKTNIGLFQFMEQKLPMLPEQEQEKQREDRQLIHRQVQLELH